MAKGNQSDSANREGVISLIGPGMTVIGDCESDGTLRIEGTVEGSVRTSKAIVVGKGGSVRGDLITQDAVIGGTVKGTVIAESRLELQSTSVVEGEVRARRIQLDEGGRLNGKVSIGEPIQPERAIPTATAETGQDGRSTDLPHPDVSAPVSQELRAGH
jgi:cytoskeletal protein CcmA (bactofilin family)